MYEKKILGKYSTLSFSHNYHKCINYTLDWHNNTFYNKIKSVKKKLVMDLALIFFSIFDKKSKTHSKKMAILKNP